jgi:pyruvate dehydrogenase E2 component (dihydrolipoamide acetyltransferase)
VGEGIHEGTIVKWHFKEGEAVKADQTIVEVETDKAIVELPSPASGTVLKRNFKEGDVVKVGEVLVVVGEPGEKIEEKPAAPKAPQPAATAQPKEAAPAPGERVLAAPATRQLARELGVSLAIVQGTGPAGRITEEDVRKAASGEAPPAVQPPSAGAKVQLEMAKEEIRIPLTGLRKTIAERMLYSKTHIPHACGMDYADVTKLVGIREEEKRIFEPRGIKLTYLPFVIKACVVALRQYPSFNAHFDNERNELVAKRDINIAIAVDTPEGLIAPVIKNADRKSIVEIAKEIDHLAEMARQRKLRLDEVTGGTFTITNIGSVGGMYSTPIINPPEVAILGVHRIKDLPLVVDGMIAARKVMGLSICFDHRVADGAIATEFMNIIKLHLEDPDLMLVDTV